MKWWRNLVDAIKSRGDVSEEFQNEQPITRGVEALLAINAVRKAKGLRTLDTNASITRVAQDWANQLSKTGLLTHGNFSSRLSRVFPNRACGECLAEGERSGSLAVQDLLRDPPHYAIITDPSYTLCGIGTAPAPIGGLFWVIDFVK